MHLIYSIIAFTCLAAGSAVNSNSSAAMNASVTALSRSGITYVAITPTSSTITNYSSGTNQTAINYLGIQKWAGQGCTGFMVENQNLTLHYGMSYVSNFTSYSSFKLSRPLRGREQLDFSREIGTDWCGKFLHSYWPRDSPVGCVDLGTFRCVRIWLN